MQTYDSGKVHIRHRKRENTADFDGGLELQKVGLLQEDLLGGSTELLNLRLLQLRVLPRLHILHLQQPPYDVVQQGRIHLLPSLSSSTLPPLFSKLLNSSRLVTVKEKRNLYKKNSSKIEEKSAALLLGKIGGGEIWFAIGVFGAQRCYLFLNLSGILFSPFPLVYSLVLVLGDGGGCLVGFWRGFGLDSWVSHSLYYSPVSLLPCVPIPQRPVLDFGIKAKAVL
ncbi:hypothetical protein U9M48_021466 [Paspalum notatum var. saurae]|uniref:Uncharacterized protein n=1 Tax=Paspalum notatum var. saurae TaxID=547442 RepID=A0AAQ3TJP2_PASNO